MLTKKQERRIYVWIPIIFLDQVTSLEVTKLSHTYNLSR